MELAPLLDRLPPSPVVSAYRAWVDHYNTCVTCQRDDWMSPPWDEPRFCDAGRLLFRSWVRHAHATPPSLGYKPRVKAF